MQTLNPVLVLHGPARILSAYFQLLDNVAKGTIYFSGSPVLWTNFLCSNQNTYQPLFSCFNTPIAKISINMELENFLSCSDRSHSAQFFHPITLIQDIAHYSLTWLKIHIHHFFIFSPFFSMWIGSRRLEYIDWIGAVSSPLWSEAKTKGPVGDQRWLRGLLLFLVHFQ